MAVYKYFDMTDGQLAELAIQIGNKLSVSKALERAIGHAPADYQDDLATQKAIKAEMSRRQREALA